MQVTVTNTVIGGCPATLAKIETVEESILVCEIPAWR